ncbi:hypothetical protein [Metabacillus schmidteae]|uniref:hypothetical protein n=1 Tax=Metabacillus schmidteae TaxID=2730405 RepID=UPI001F44A1EE|nr:hypothetical protein [Metabacillus schmidteae]
MALGENPKVVADRLGHSRVQVTLDIYSHVSTELQRQTANKFEQDFFSDNVHSSFKLFFTIGSEEAKKLQSLIYQGIEASHSDDPRGIRTPDPYPVKIGWGINRVKCNITALNKY